MQPAPLEFDILTGAELEGHGTIILPHFGQKIFMKCADEKTILMTKISNFYRKLNQSGARLSCLIIILCSKFLFG